MTSPSAVDIKRCLRGHLKMNKMQLGKGVVHFLAVTTVILFACEGVTGTAMCSTPDVTRNDHIEAIKRYILSKLDLEEPPENPQAPDSSAEEVEREYQALVTAGEYTDKTRKPCVTQNDDSAPELLVYFPEEIKEVIYYDHPAGQPDSGSPVRLGRIQIFYRDVASTVPCRVALSYSFIYSYKTLFIITSISALRYLIKTFFIPGIPRPDDRYRLKFWIDLRNRSTIKYSELRLYTLSRNDDITTTKADDRVEVFLMQKPTAQFYNEIEYPVFIAAQRVSSDTSGYIFFDIADAIDLWKRTVGDQKLGEMELEIRLKFPVVHINNSDHLYNPGIQLEVDNKKLIQVVIKAVEGQEQRRSLSITSCSSTSEPNCCLRPLSINFHQDLNWTWVSHPISAEVNYCNGLCPAYWGSDTDHVFFTNYLNSISKNNPTAAPEPCCVAKIMKPLHMRIRLPNHNFTTVTLTDVITEGCVCR